MASFTWYPHRVALLKRLAGEGWSARQIAAHFGVSRNAVIGASHRNDVTLRGPRFTTGGGRKAAPDSKKIEAVTLHLCGYALAEVGARFNVSTSTIFRWKGEAAISQRAALIADQIRATKSPPPKPPKRKRSLSPEERARRAAWMSQMVRARWARIRAERQEAA